MLYGDDCNKQKDFVLNVTYVPGTNSTGIDGKVRAIEAFEIACMAIHTKLSL